ncbi:MAG: SDR family oxidoreductase, partial [Ilumatobacteraceae bacterium]
RCRTRRLNRQDPVAGAPQPPTGSLRVAALLIGTDGAFITSSDYLLDGGITASYFHGELAPR